MEDYNGLKELEKLKLELVKGCWEECYGYINDCLKYIKESREYLAMGESNLDEFKEYFGIQREK